MQSFFVSTICKSLNIKEHQVINTLKLLEDGCTIPFISRYRKELTGSLDEVKVEQIQKEYAQLNNLSNRKQTIIKSLLEQEKLTKELEQKINDSWDEKEIEDLYLPFKSKRKTKADLAIEAGLAPLAKMILAQNNGNIENATRQYICNPYPTEEDVLIGAKEIAAQWISERIGVRNLLRRLFLHEAVIQSKSAKSDSESAEKYKDYFDFTELAKKSKSHRILAILRGAEEGYLKVSIQPDKKLVLQ